jgi:hypothetical protein
MITAISNATQTPPAAPSTGTSTHKPTQSEAKFAPSTDSVQLSKTAQAMLAALKEAAETPAQTAKEAGNGDVQAQGLLAKETAAKSVAR